MWKVFRCIFLTVISAIPMFGMGAGLIKIFRKVGSIDDLFVNIIIPFWNKSKKLPGLIGTTFLDFS